MAGISKETGSNNGKTLADFAPPQLKIMAQDEVPVKLGERPCLCRRYHHAENPDHRIMEVHFPRNSSETKVHLHELVPNGD
jgi:hypothetical protein